MQNTEKVKELYLSTIQSKCFLDGIDAFKEKMETLFDENEVSIDWLICISSSIIKIYTWIYRSIDGDEEQVNFTDFPFQLIDSI